jgi:hypothetical protein
VIVLVCSSALAGCCLEQPRHALPTAPDHECSTGTTHGFDIAVWDCVDGERVVAWRRSTEMTCSGVTVERAACGEPTEVERELDEGERSECAGAVLPS